MKTLNSKEKLQSYDRKYYFHGSPIQGLKVLEPRLTYNIASDDKFTNGNSVYAADNYQEACVYALLNFKEIPKELKGKKVSVESDENGPILVIPKEWEKYIKSNVGSIYVLPTDTFKERKGSNVKSNLSVEVIDEIYVSFDDFIQMGCRMVII